MGTTIGKMTRVAAFLLLVLAPSWNAHSQSLLAQTSPQPVVLVARMQKNGVVTYRLNGKKVEDSVQNSLLMNLGGVVRSRGKKVPVDIIVDVRAPFSEVGKLETALDKSDLTNRRVYVSNFKDGTMNEIHWDDRAIPLPPND